MDVANRHFAIRQDTQNPKSGRVGQRSVHPCKFMNPGHLAAKCTMASVFAIANTAASDRDVA